MMNNNNNNKISNRIKIKRKEKKKQRKKRKFMIEENYQRVKRLGFQLSLLLVKFYAKEV